MFAYDSLSEKQLADYFGKDIADQIVSGKGRKGYQHNNEGGWITFNGKDLELGGEGMKGFYDKMLPAFADKYARKWGAKTQDIQLPGIEGNWHSIDVTPEMKESVMGGQLMFSKNAPNGKPSNLDDQQWELVRTKYFKGWFGDWESLFIYQPKRIYHSVDEAFDFVKSLFDKPLTNKKYGFTAIISKNKASKLKSGKAIKKSIDERLHALALSNIDNLFENARILVTHPDIKGIKEIEKVCRFGSLIYDKVTNEYIPVKITAFEYNSNTGNKIYSIEAVDIESEKSAGQLEDGNINSPHSPIADYNTKVRQLLEDANNSSKVIDENGEPLVVYHGTQWDPYAEKNGDAVFNSGWFTGLRHRAEGFGNPIQAFLNIKNPVYASEIDGEFPELPEGFD